MAIQMIVMQCPKCNANLQIEADRKKAFCNYCGAEILIDNTNEHIYRTIDETKIKETEAEYQYKTKQLEAEQAKNKYFLLFLAIGVITGAILLIVLLSLYYH